MTTSKLDMRSDIWTSYLIFILTLVPLAGMTHSRVFMAGNDSSRFAHIESLVDYGMSNIDESRYHWTDDRVTIRGLNYSNKPPLLGIIGAGVYWVLQKTLGLSFARNEAMVVRMLTIILVGVPTAWLVAEFYMALGVYQGITEGIRWLVTAALAWGTILNSFSVTLNNHTVAAALLFAAIYAAWRGKGVWAGLWGGLTVSIDIAPGLGFVPVLMWILYGAAGWHELKRCLVLMVGNAVLFVAMNFFTVGSPLPPKLVSGAVDQSVKNVPSLWGVIFPETWYYPIECLLSWRGFFTVSPVLIFGVVGLYVAMRRLIVLRPSWCIAIGVGVGLQIIAHVSLAGSFGGWAYGFRYLIPVIPIVLFFTPVVLGSWRTVLFAGVLPISVIFALLGAYNPWPPVYERKFDKPSIPSLVTNPIGGNAAAWLEQFFPTLALSKRFGEMFISPHPELRRRYFIYFYGSKGDVGRMKMYQRRS